uniref:Single Ig IL-1-related receptor-like n=1 Tax=Cyprinodon variegatus TaxID=28743 RepID=A0A3Q2DUK9_CYPVA
MCCLLHSEAPLPCAKAPDFQQDSNPSKLWKSRGASVKLNCTALLFWDPSEEPCETTPQWSKDGKPLNNQTLYLQNTTSWSPDAGQLVVSSLLEFALREPEQFGLYSCTVRNISSDFSLQNSSKLGNSVNSPKAAVCISRQGLLHLLELCQQPILITLEGQIKRMSPEIKRELSENQHRLTLLTWRQNSVTPSSSFWKELALAMPRSVIFHKESAGDPQTVLQDDKDPMLTLDPDYLDCRSDIDPAGDLGLRLPVNRALACKAPVLPAAPTEAAQPKASDIDVSDLGSRNYGARSDFYCLVTEDI